MNLDSVKLKNLHELYLRREQLDRAIASLEEIERERPTSRRERCRRGAALLSPDSSGHSAAAIR